MGSLEKTMPVNTVSFDAEALGAKVLDAEARKRKANRLRHVRSHVNVLDFLEGPTKAALPLPCTAVSDHNVLHRALSSAKPSPGAGSFSHTTPALKRSNRCLCWLGRGSSLRCVGAGARLFAGEYEFW